MCVWGGGGGRGRGGGGKYGPNSTRLLVFSCISGVISLIIRAVALLTLYVRFYHRSVTIASIALSAGLLSTLAESR